MSVVIPTYNEAGSIRGVVDKFFETGAVDEVVVVDNNALGNTREEVTKTKARLVHEQKQGYGHAIMRGLKEAKGDLIVVTEGDGTFQSKDIEKFLSYSDEFDVVLGSRTSREIMWEGAFMPYPVRFGNWLWAKWVEILFDGPVLTDIGCTYKLVSRKALNKVIDMFTLSRGDGTFNPEFIIWLLRRRVKAVEIPIIYKERVGKSMYTGSIWRAFKLGLKMVPVILKYLFKKI